MCKQKRYIIKKYYFPCQISSFNIAGCTSCCKIETDRSKETARSSGTTPPSCMAAWAKLANIRGRGIATGWHVFGCAESL